ncbi:MAG TPA: hypothetical protein VFT46_07120 [Holophagaceae bacterium]|nr:hypothetical protein [Holophagaceae bacterium]
MSAPSISISPILSVDQGVAVARYLRGEGPKPADLPQGYILPNGEPAHAAPAGVPSASVDIVSKPFPWAWVAVGLLALGAVALVARNRRG